MQSDEWRNRACQTNNRRLCVILLRDQVCRHACGDENCAWGWSLPGHQVLSARQTNVDTNDVFQKWFCQREGVGGRWGGGARGACNMHRQGFLCYPLGPGRASPFCLRPSFALWQRHSWPACHPWHLSLWAWPALAAAHRHLSLWTFPAFAAAHRHEQPIGGLTGRLTGKWMPHCLWLLDHD